jgi:sigma-E factor negative regulatory protein RseC
MLEEKAIVVKTDQQFAWVETQRQSTCGSCSVNKGCGTSVLQKVLGQKRTRLKVPNQSNYRVGDTVVLGLQENALLKGSLLMYGLPLVFMFGFALLGAAIFFLYDWSYSEPAKIGFSLTGLVLGFIAIARKNKGINQDPDYQAIILRKLDMSS